MPTHPAPSRAPLAASALALAIATLPLGACKTGGNAESRARDVFRMRQEEAEAARRSLAFVREGQRFEKIKNLPKALESYKQAVDAYPESPIAWNNLGRLYMMQGDNMEAAAAFQKASELSLADPVPVHNLGALWESMGWPDDAQRYYNEALQRNADYVPSLYRSVLLDVQRNKVTDLTQQRLKRALFLNKDPDRQQHLLRAQVRMRDGSVDMPADGARAQPSAGLDADSASH